MRNHADAEESFLNRVEEMLSLLREAIVQEAIHGGCSDVINVLLADLHRYIKKGFYFIEERIEQILEEAGTLILAFYPVGYGQPLLQAEA